jgi:hypothetical protein
MNRDDLLREAEVLRSAHTRGDIDSDTFAARWAALRAQDGDGTWWAVDGSSGNLVWFDAGSGTWRPPVPASRPNDVPQVGPPASESAPDRAQRSGARAYLGLITREPTGLLGLLLAVLLSLFVAHAGWDVLSFPPRFLAQQTVVQQSLGRAAQSGVQDLGCREAPAGSARFYACAAMVGFGYGKCSGYQAGTLEMYVCSSTVAARVSTAPLLMILFLFLLVKPLARGLSALINRLPEEVRFLGPPALATAVFTMMWAHAHYATANETGIVGQQSFPAVIGAFTYATMRYTRLMQRVFAGFFAFRDHIPWLFRFLITLAVPTLASLAMTYQQRASWLTNSASIEQRVVLIALIAGYLLLVPGLKRKRGKDERGAPGASSAAPGVGQ